MYIDDSSSPEEMLMRRNRTYIVMAYIVMAYVVDAEKSNHDVLVHGRRRVDVTYWGTQRLFFEQGCVARKARSSFFFLAKAGLTSPKTVSSQITRRAAIVPARGQLSFCDNSLNVQRSTGR